MRTLDRKPREWVTVAGSEAGGHAVRFLMRPATQFEFDLAVERASAAARQLAQGEEARRLYGLDELPAEIFGGEEEEPVIGVSTTLVATELAMLVASDVDGYCDAAGEKYPFDRRHVGMIMMDWVGGSSVARQFQERALTGVYRAFAEGKPFAAALSGIGAAAAHTARDAGTPAPPAPEASPAQTESSAPPSKTPRRQKKG